MHSSMENVWKETFVATAIVFLRSCKPSPVYRTHMFALCLCKYGYRSGIMNRTFLRIKTALVYAEQPTDHAVRYPEGTTLHWSVTWHSEETASSLLKP